MFPLNTITPVLVGGAMTLSTSLSLEQPRTLKPRTAHSLMASIATTRAQIEEAVAIEVETMKAQIGWDEVEEEMEWEIDGVVELEPHRVSVH